MAADDTDAPSGRHKKADGPEPTHDLTLADGSTVESYGAIPTHVAVGDQAIRVVQVIER